MHPNVRRDLALFPVSRGSYFQPPIPMIAFRSRRIPVLKPDRMGARMRIIALLLAFVFVRRCGDGGYDDLARHGTARGLRVLPRRRAPRFNGACPNSPAAAWRNYAARDLPFPDRATLAFLTGLIVADTESMCGG